MIKIYRLFKNDFLKILIAVLAIGFVYYLTTTNSVKKSIESSVKSDTILESSINIKAGQYWKKIKYEKNPYTEAVYDTLIIIDTKEDWSKYILKGDTFVSSNSYITHNSILIN